MSDAAPIAPTRKPRLAWIVGTRGEALTLGPLFAALCRGPHAPYLGWLLTTGEDGMALTQALDHLGLIPDEEAPLCSATEEPAQRVHIILERVEAFFRQRKATHIVFGGCGPAALASALHAHARVGAGMAGGGLWLTPHDPAGLLQRLHWEAGVRRMIEACRPAVDILPMHAAALVSPNNAIAPQDVLPALRPSAPRVLVAVQRREWGLFSNTCTALVRAAAAWARALPQAEIIVLSRLSARLESPLRALEDRPPNLHLLPPLTLEHFTALVTGAAAMLTDLPGCAAVAFEHGVPLATLGDAATAADTALCLAITPADLAGSDLSDWMAARVQMQSPPPATTSFTPDPQPVLDAMRQWLGDAALATHA